MTVENVVLNNYSYGCGCITDLKHKLNINVSNFSAEKFIAESSKIKVNGLLRNNLNTLILQLPSMDDIQIDGDEIATAKQMKKGFLCLKPEEKASSNSSTAQDTQRQSTPPNEHQNNSNSVENESPKSVSLI